MTRVCRGLKVQIAGREFQFDALILDISSYDALLIGLWGMMRSSIVPSVGYE
jgi:hypothetical protein